MATRRNMISPGGDINSGWLLLATQVDTAATPRRQLAQMRPLSIDRLPALTAVGPTAIRENGKQGRVRIRFFEAGARYFRRSSPSWCRATGRSQRMPMVRHDALLQANLPPGLEIYVATTGRLRDGFPDVVLRALRQHHPRRWGRPLPHAVRSAPRIREAKGGGAARLRQLPCAVRPQRKHHVPGRAQAVLEQSEVLIDPRY